MLKDIITLDCINIDLKGTTKSEIIDEMIDILYKASKLNDREEYKREILKRESQGSTGMEEGIRDTACENKRRKNFNGCNRNIQKTEWIINRWMESLPVYFL